MAFLKTANCKISAVVFDLQNIEYAPEALKIDGGWGEDLIQSMANVLPIKDNTGSYLYIRNRAISSVEEFGYNENKDAWLYSELKKDYPTFIGAAVCCNHVNDDESKFYGIIPDSAFITSGSSRKDWFDCSDWRGKNFSDHFKYGDQSGWVENVLAINKDLINLDYPGLIGDLESGKVVGTSMGCLKPGTLITLSDGTQVPIEDISTGDEVYTHTGGIKRVTETFVHPVMPDENVYKIKVVGVQDDIIITGEHPVWCLKRERLDCLFDKRIRGIKCKPERKHSSYCEKNNCGRYEEDYKFEFVATEDLEKGDYAATLFPTDETDQDYLSEDFASLFGWYLAEGHLNKDYRGKDGFVTTVFSLGGHEKEYAKEIRNLSNKLSSSGIFEHRVDIEKQNEFGVESGSCRMVNVWNPKIANKFFELGGRYSREKCLAEEVLYWPVKYQKLLLSSFIKGDGCQLLNSKYSNKTVHLATSSEKLANQLYLILLRCGIVPYLRRLKRKPTGFRDYEAYDWQIDIESNQIAKLAEFVDVEVPEIKSNFRGRRFIYKNYLVAPIEKIEEVDYQGDVYNFEVEEDHSYIANYIATHNCICGRSVCSICGNSASSPSSYCEHVANLRSHGLVESDNLYELNFENTFFEDSIITANTHADEHAIILSKYAEAIPFLKALNSAEEQVRKQIRGEFVPYIKISDKVLTSKKEIENYCKGLLGDACSIKEATEKMVGGKVRGHYDMGVREKDIAYVERSKKDPASIGKKYVWDSRNPTNKVASILQNVAGYFKLNEKLADELEGVIKGVLDKYSEEIGTMDAITGLIGPTSLAEPPHSYIENLEGADIDEEEAEKDEDYIEALEDFEPPIIWADEQESIPGEDVEEFEEGELGDVEGVPEEPEEDLEGVEPEEGL